MYGDDRFYQVPTGGPPFLNVSGSLFFHRLYKRVGYSVCGT